MLPIGTYCSPVGNDPERTAKCRAIIGEMRLLVDKERDKTARETRLMERAVNELRARDAWSKKP